ncbi:MAG: DUF1385 domain-containing protein [Spirochaetota bacterium]
MKKQEDNYYGGQALIEGIMMRGKSFYSIAIRKPDKSLKLIKKDISSILQKYKWLKAPFMRGIVALIENLVIGVKALIISANEALPEEASVEKEDGKKPGKGQKGAQKLDNLTISVSLIISFAVAILFFVALPNFFIELGLGINAQKDIALYNIISGLLRILLFILYVWAISFMKDIKRVFQYHGAEHKTINAYEAGEELTISNVKKYPTFHPRCGTSFLFFVLLVAVIIFSFVTLLLNLIPFMAGISGSRRLIDRIIRQSIITPSHIVMLPVIASVSYEILKFSFKKKGNILIKLLSLPGKGIQKLTAKEPGEEMLEVGIAALKEVLQA